MNDSPDTPAAFRMRRFLNDYEGLAAIEAEVHESGIGWIWAGLTISDDRRTVDLDFSTNAKDSIRVLNKVDRLLDAVVKFRDALNASVANILADEKARAHGRGQS